MHILRAGDIVFHVEKMLVCKGETREHQLTPGSTLLLSVFMYHPDEVLSHRFLCSCVGFNIATLRVHIRWLRESIEDDPSKPVYLRTVYGVGYRFCTPDEEQEGE